MEAAYWIFQSFRDAQSLKKRLAESYTSSIRRASTPANEANEWVNADLRRDVPGAELCARPWRDVSEL